MRALSVALCGPVQVAFRPDWILKGPLDDVFLPLAFVGRAFAERSVHRREPVLPTRPWRQNIRGGLRTTASAGGANSWTTGLRS